LFVIDHRYRPSGSRRMDYIHGARQVVEGLRGTNAFLEKQFDEAAVSAESNSR
jgi:hypothetical protein